MIAWYQAIMMQYLKGRCGLAEKRWKTGICPCSEQNIVFSPSTAASGAPIPCLNSAVCGYGASRRLLPE